MILRPITVLSDPSDPRFYLGFWPITDANWPVDRIAVGLGARVYMIQILYITKYCRRKKRNLPVRYK